MDARTEPELFDATARKVHQWLMVALVVIAFLGAARWAPIPLLIAGVIMVGGRFFWPLDVARQLTWRVLEPAHLLPRLDRAEDHQTRRIARVLGGVIWIAAAILVGAGLSTLGFVLAGLIAVMVVLDASVDFCVLCFLSAQLGLHQSRAS
ncbi:MAG: DUF4395 family protein [Candidatus Dormibacteraceae bacterium]